MHAEVPRGAFEVLEDPLRHAVPADLWLDVHALDLGGLLVQLAQRAATDCPPIGPRDDEGTEPGCEMRRLEVGPKPLVMRVPAGEVRVKGGDKSACIGRVEGLRNDGDVQ